MISKATISAIPLVFLLFTSFITEVYCQSIRTVNTAQSVGNGRFKWSIYLLSTQQVLDKISYVEYHLHPTFNDPIVKINNRANNFKLQSNGWGEFNIHIKIYFENGYTSELDHWLKLRDGQQSVQNEDFNVINTVDQSIQTGNTSERAGSSWKWTVFISGSADVMNSIRCVTYTLHPTFSNPVQEICTRGNNQNKSFPLTARGWGTFRINIVVKFSDGRIQELHHDLVFQ